MPDLTDLQQRVLTFIQRSVRHGGKAPSYRQIAVHLGVDVRSAFQHVQALERKGILERSGGHIALLGDHRPPEGIPVLGRVAAGAPILAVENVEGHLDLGRRLQDENLFLLKVKGDSMVDAGINDGDLVLTRRQDSVESGEIAVVVIGEEATVKRVRPVNGGLRLEPANPKYEPFTVKGDEVRIAGRVLMAVRVFADDSGAAER